MFEPGEHDIIRVCEIASLTEQTRSDLYALKQSLQQIESDAENSIADCKKSREDLTDSVKNMSEEVDEMKTRFIKLFDDAKKKMLTKANAFKCEEVKRLDDISAVYARIKEEISQLVPTCSTLLEHGTPQQMFITVKYIDEKHQRMKTSISTQQMVQLTPKLAMSFPRELSELLEMGDNVVELNFERNKSDQASSDSPSSPPRPVTLELLVSVDLLDVEFAPFLSGLDFLPDGRLVAVDNNNKKCIIFNELLQIQGSPYTFKMPPLTVSACQNGMTVTTGNKTLHLMSLSSDNVISLTRVFSTSSQFGSICHKTPSVMVVSSYNDSRPARMVTMDGVESDFDRVEFPKKRYKFGDSNCTFVQSNNTLVLTDRKAHKVHMYDIVKGTSRTVTDVNIQYPDGACVGPGGTVLVRTFSNIVHMSIYGEILGTYPLDMEFPYSLGMSKDGTKLAVSNGSGTTRKLQLYKISRT